MLSDGLKPPALLLRPPENGQALRRFSSAARKIQRGRLKTPIQGFQTASSCQANAVTRQTP
ncbi:hypothetical protein HMPREF9120_01054 [Neisseria sp. oral taxon 020 str. F0370]|nr:hypothetical protein HMPREF9120_01054 [Neisseria sp. oral taxon 020 str. F0370]